MNDSSHGPSSLLQDFTAQQHANVFLRAFSFPTTDFPRHPEDDAELADCVALLENIGFIFLLKEREQRVATKPGDLEKWVVNNVVKKGVKQIQNTRDLLDDYMGLSVVNHFGHRVSVTPAEGDDLVSVIIYRVPPKSRAFHAARFKKNRNGGFVHILRDVDYFEICEHFVTPAEMLDYFGFRREVLTTWGAVGAAVGEDALIGQYLLEEYSSGPDQMFESAARSRRGATAYEFSFVLDSLAGKIAGQRSDYADTDFYEILTELALLGRYELKALKHQLRVALEAVRGNRFELPFRIASARTACGFLVVPLTAEFRDRAIDALKSLSLASKHELDLPRQVGIGMWNSYDLFRGKRVPKSEFVDIEWTFMEGDNPPNPELDERLASRYPFRTASEQRLPPIFT